MVYGMAKQSKNDQRDVESWSAFERAVDAAVKGGPKHRAVDNKAERSASAKSTKKFWIIPDDNGLSLTDLDTAKSQFVWLFQVPKGAIKNNRDGVDSGCDDACMIHFPLGADVGILEVVNEFVSKHFDGRSSFVAARDCERSQSDIKRALQSAYAADKFLGGCALHCLPSRGASRNWPSLFGA
jgi:hypothetical protein